MAFSCSCEIEIRGGAAQEREKAAALILASDAVDEGSASRPGGAAAEGAADAAIRCRFESVDGLPEDELALLAGQFPSLSLMLVYFSLDGEFFGYAKAGAPGAAAESEDFAEDTRDEVGRRYDGDGIAFVRARYGLARADE